MLKHGQEVTLTNKKPKTCFLMFCQNLLTRQIAYTVSFVFMQHTVLKWHVALIHNIQDIHCNVF